MGKHKGGARWRWNPLELQLRGPADARAALCRQVAERWWVGLAGKPSLSAGPSVSVVSGDDWTQTHLRHCDFALVEHEREGPLQLVEQSTDAQIDATAEAVACWLTGHVAARPLHGLVLVGGRSTRMGRDKAGISYVGCSQARRCLDLLSPFVRTSWISCRNEQDLPADVSGVERLPDVFLEMGPLGGIASAMRKYPEAAWLVLGCDLPLVEPETLDALVAARAPLQMATAFKASDSGLPEPLCAIYEPKALFDLMHAVAQARCCPRKVLLSGRVKLLEQQNPRWLANANTPQELAAFQRELGVQV